MTVTATSALAVVIAALRTTLSLSSEFQSETGGTAAEALERIHLDYFEDEEVLELLRPCGIITEEQWGYTTIGVGDGHYLQGGGVLLLTLTRNAEYTEDHTDSKLDFLNWADQVITDLRDVAADNTSFPATSITLETRAQRTMRAVRNVNHDYWWTRYAIAWGEQQ